MDWSKFDETVDLKGLQADSESAGGGDYEEVPHGSYEVSIEKLELAESKKGDPMVKVWFRIHGGDYDNAMLFMNQVVTKGFQLHICNELIRSFDVADITFKSYAQYDKALQDISKLLEESNKTYELEYGETNKGFNTFKIMQVFEN